MTAVDPTKLAEITATGWLDDDASETADWTTCGTDDTTNVSCVRIQVGAFERARMEFSDFDGVANNDTIQVYVKMVRGGTTYALLAYTDANSVTATDKITGSWPADNSNFTITLTTAFIAQLGDLGSNTWAVRLTEDADGSMDVEFNEVDADITSGGVATPHSPFGLPLHGPLGGPV